MITGAILLGAQDVTSARGFRAVDPSTGRPLDPVFAAAGDHEVDAACRLAASAFPVYALTAPQKRAAFLEAIAERILALGDELIVRAMAETGLPRGRLEGERGRTVGQLRLFASVVRDGDWLDITIDPALPARKPLPRSDLRRVNVPLGPVAVFGASNFPLAFSVAGGDTASALAAGCPVIVKGHPAHPGTGELVGRAIRAAVAACGLPDGVFSLLPGDGHGLGAALVAHPGIRAVGFTGSRAGGLALLKIAAARAEPVAVYAEMSSINPVILMPAALAARAVELARAFVQSLTLGAGQFCTNPGVVLALAGPDLEVFTKAAAEAISLSDAGQMLTPAIHSGFESGVAALEAHRAVTVLARGRIGTGVNQARGALFHTRAVDFLADPALGHEVFGSASIVVACASLDEMKRVIAAMDGQLTATVHLEPTDESLAAELIPLLAAKAGRVLANGWPTGVEVTHAMVHGGPYPATSDGRTTSVGSLAMLRFLRPVCYQDLPERLLPEALRSGNPLGLARRIDGAVTPAS